MNTTLTMSFPSVENILFQKMLLPIAPSTIEEPPSLPCKWEVDTSLRETMRHKASDTCGWRAVSIPGAQPTCDCKWSVERILTTLLMALRS